MATCNECEREREAHLINCSPVGYDETLPVPQKSDMTSLSSALFELEQSVLRELLRLAEANSAGDLHPATFEAASSGVRASLRRHAEQVDALEQLAAVQDRPSEEEEVRALVRRHRAEAGTLSMSLRELAAKVRSDRSQREASERAALFAPVAGYDSSDGSSAPSGASSRSGRLNARASAQAARDVTESLRRTRALMANELQRTEATLRSLDEQGKKLRGTLNEHRGIDGTLASGRRKLNRLETRDMTDKVLFALAFGFFVCVVLHIVNKRLGLGLFGLASSLAGKNASDVLNVMAVAADGGVGGASADVSSAQVDSGGGSSAAVFAATSATAAADDLAHVVASAVSDLMSEAAAAAAATGVAMECSAAADAPMCNEEVVAATAATSSRVAAPVKDEV